MKNLIVLLTISTLSTSALAEETSWFDSLKSLVGLGETTEQTIDAPATTKQSTDGLVDMLTSSLDVNADQAAGGMGAIFNFVKDNVSADQFSSLAKSVPGVEGLVDQMPDLSQLNSGSSEGFGGLLDKASQYSDSLKSVNDIKKQFEALGLKPEMITDFIATAKSYLDTEQGQQAKQILTDGLGSFLG